MEHPALPNYSFIYSAQSSGLRSEHTSTLLMSKHIYMYILHVLMVCRTTKGKGFIYFSRFSAWQNAELHRTILMCIKPYNFNCINFRGFTKVHIIYYYFSSKMYWLDSCLRRYETAVALQLPSRGPGCMVAFDWPYYSTLKIRGKAIKGKMFRHSSPGRSVSLNCKKKFNNHLLTVEHCFVAQTVALANIHLKFAVTTEKLSKCNYNISVQLCLDFWSEFCKYKIHMIHVSVTGGQYDKQLNANIKISKFSPLNWISGYIHFLLRFFWVDYEINWLLTCWLWHNIDGWNFHAEDQFSECNSCWQPILQLQSDWP